MSILSIGELVYAQREFDETDFNHKVFPLKNITSREDFFKKIKHDEYKDVKAIYRRLHNKVIGRFDREVIQALPASVKVIGNAGAGYDQIDVAACTERGIYVTNTPDAVREATADTALFLLLAVLRNFGEGISAIQNHEWLGSCRAGRCPSSRKIGILGMGSIGIAFAKRCLALGCSIQYHNRKQSDDAPEAVNFVTFDELLASSDVLFVSVPLNANTKHLIGANEFARMRKGSYLINTARGPIVDENAMVSALDQGILRGVGLDVFENEPSVHPGLIGRPGCVLLPHMGTHTQDASRLMEIMALNNMLNVLQGGRQSIVPEQVDCNF